MQLTPSLREGYEAIIRTEIETKWGLVSLGDVSRSLAHELATRCGPDGDIVLCLPFTGPSWGEMAALRVGDLDKARRRVIVNQAVAEVGRDLVYGTPKNHSRRRNFERAVRELVSNGVNDVTKDAR